jgi:hypothetical protein
MRADRVGQRFQHDLCRTSRQAVEVDVLARLDDGLPVQRDVVAILRDDDKASKAGPDIRYAARDRQAPRGGCAIISLSRARSFSAVHTPSP